MPVRYVGRTATIILTTCFAVLSVFLVYATLALWPIMPAAGSPEAIAHPGQPICRYFLWWRVNLDVDRSYFLVVVLGGALGAMLYVVRSFSKYVGTRRLVWSWIPKYALMPVQGGVLAAITYIVLRAGLLTGPVSTDGNPFGFVSIGVLVGLFSEQAVSKLKDAMETILTPTPPGSDPAGEQAATDAKSTDQSNEDQTPSGH